MAKQAKQAKLGRPTDQRMAILRGLATDLLRHGKITTTKSRAREVRRIAERLIATAIREQDNFTSKQIKVSSAKLDGSGKKITKASTSKNGKAYRIVEREHKTKMVTIDNPSRLHARRLVLKTIYRAKDENGNIVNVANLLFDEIARKYKGRNGGYTRVYNLGRRRGDGAEVVILELV